MLVIVCLACLILAIVAFVIAGVAWKGKNDAMDTQKRQSEVEAPA